MADGDFDLALAISGDGSGAVAAAGTVERAIGGLEKAQASAAGSAERLESATENVGKAQESTAAATAGAAAATTKSTTEQEKAARAASNSAIALARLSAAEARLQIAQDGAAASSEKGASAITAANARVSAATASLLTATERYRLSQLALKPVQEDATKAARAQQYAIKDVGQQFGDFGIQVLSGQDPIRAFTQQSGQLGYALGTLQSGPLAKLGAFLTGPWGIAFTLGASVVAQLIEKMQGVETAAEKEAAALKTVEGATKALDEATGRLSKSKAEQIRLSAAATEAQLKEALATRTLLAARLQGQDKAPVLGDELGGAAQAVARSSTVGAISDNDKAIASLRASLSGRDFAAAVDTAKARTDKAAAANQEYERTVDRIKAAYERSGKSAHDLALVTDLLTTANRKHEAATKASAAASTALSDAQAKVLSAHGAVAQAVANLALVRAKANADLKAHNITESERTSLIAAAEEKVNAARDAERGLRQARVDGAKATREATAEDREYVRILETLEAKYKPLTAAAKNYAEQISNINALKARGKIDLGDQVLFSIGAANDARDVEGKAESDAAKRIFPPDVQAQFDQDVKELEASFTSGATNAKDILKGGIRDAFKTAATDIGGLIGGKAGATATKGISALSGLFGSSPETQAKNAAFTDAIGKISKGVGISESAASLIGKIGGKAFAGAQTGELANSLLQPLGKLIGVKTSKTGAELGGAVGNFLPIPGGSIIGSIAGSIIGGLFKTSKNGGATIGADGSISGSGNSASRIAAATGIAKSVQDGVAQIAAQLGGTVGSLSPITIGTYGKNNEYRVNTTGGSTLGGSKNQIAGVQYFASGDEGAAAALAYSIKLQVQRGAIAGLDAAVTRAITENSDLDKGIAEALQVKQVEQIIGGVGQTLKDTFDSFDATAKSNLAIAQKYGLDAVALEKKTADQRTALIADTLKTSVGSLQTFLDSVKFGSLADGSGVDIRNALVDQIKTLQPKAEAGDQTSIDALSPLLQQLLTSDKTTFGTAGTQYTSDKDLAVSAAQKVIDMETKRINDAAATGKATLDAILAGNTQTNETNDQLAVANSTLSDISDYLAYLSSGGTSGLGAADTSRYTSLA